MAEKFDPYQSKPNNPNSTRFFSLWFGHGLKQNLFTNPYLFHQSLKLIYNLDANTLSIIKDFSNIYFIFRLGVHGRGPIRNKIYLSKYVL